MKQHTHTYIYMDTREGNNKDNSEINKIENRKIDLIKIKILSY